jgi:prepilin-type N-terminal cleavage/methylation domain-containing protein
MHSKFKSFTLIELLVVIVIIGILSTLISFSQPAIMARARDAKISQDFHELLNLAEKINSEKNSYDSICQGSSPCNQDLQLIYDDIAKQKGTLVTQKPERNSQTYCAFSPLNSPNAEGQTQYYCADNSGTKIKTTLNPGLNDCTNASFRCPAQLAKGEEEGEIIIPPMTADAQSIIISTTNYPKFSEATIDPLDVKLNDIQTMLVKVEDPDEIAWIRADIEHDNGKDTVMLNLASGDSKSGTWFGKWLVYDTHKATYHTIFTAQNKKGKQNKIVLAWTDPCLPSLGSDWDLDSNCSITGVNGVDNGNFRVVNGYTFTIQSGATWVINSGKSMTKVSGSVAIVKGGTMRKTNLWMIDHDHDGYPASSTTQIAQDAVPTDGRRRNEMTSYYLDYNDASSTIFFGQTCNGDCSTNNSDGTCGAKATGCLGTCQRCNGTSLDALYLTAGKVCSGGSEVAPTSGNKCDATIDCTTNACSASTYYRGCTAGATTCVDTGRVSGTAWNASAGSVINQTTYKTDTTCTQAVPTASLKCNTVLANDNNCQYTTYYRACGGAGACRTDNTGAGTAQTTCAANQATKGVTSCTAVTTANYCQTLTNGCNGTCKTMANYYGCSSSGSTCEGTSRATSDVANCAAATYCSGGSCTSGNCGALACYSCNTSGSCVAAADTSCTGANNCTQTFGSGYTVNKFTGNGSWTPPCGVTQVEYLVVAGGGGGGGDVVVGGGGSGGGAGGFLTATGFAVSGTGITVVVGAGGTGGIARSVHAISGGNSTFSTIIATGGGAGDWLGQAAENGGSGGGGSADGGIHGHGITGQGYAGGESDVLGSCASGGGGAGALGANTTDSTHGSNGGTGVSSSITGISTCYAGGGGGGGYTQLGGIATCGGGNGGQQVQSDGVSGTNNFGGGGGGATLTVSGTNHNGGNGGSGVVIIRYLTP